MELRPLTDRAGFAGSTAMVTAAAVQVCGSIAEAGVAAVCRKRVTTSYRRLPVADPPYGQQRSKRGPLSNFSRISAVPKPSSEGQNLAHEQTS